MIGYKVVYKFDGRLFSYNYTAKTMERMENFMKKGTSVEYKLNEKTFPLEGCGPLCVFTNLASLKYFIRCDDIDIFEIYKCEYEESDTRLIWDLVTEKQSIDYYMPGYYDEIPYDSYTTANWVKLLELVE